ASPPTPQCAAAATSATGRNSGWICKASTTSPWSSATAARRSPAGSTPPTRPDHSGVSRPPRPRRLRRPVGHFFLSCRRLLLLAPPPFPGRDEYARPGAPSGTPRLVLVIDVIEAVASEGERQAM